MKSYTLGNKRIHMLEVYDGGAMFIGAFVLQILLQFILSMILVATKVPDTFLYGMAGASILTVLNGLALAATPLAYSKIRSANILEGVGFRRGFSPLQGLLLIAIALFTILAFAPLANGFSWLIEKSGYHSESLAGIQIRTGGDLALGIVFLCVIPAVCEELLYRGIVARAFGDRGMIFGILFSGLLFAVMHGNPLQLVHQFFLGCVCAFVYYGTRSIYASVFVHFLNNLVSIVGNFVLFRTGADLSPAIWVWALVSAGGLIGLTLLLWAFYRIARKKKGLSPSLRGGLNERLRELFDTDTEKELKRRERSAEEAQLLACDGEEIREVLLSARKQDAAKLRKKNNLALIYAFVIAAAVWILNTVMGYFG